MQKGSERFLSIEMRATRYLINVLAGDFWTLLAQAAPGRRKISYISMKVQSV